VTERPKILLDRLLHEQFVTDQLACSIPAGRSLFGHGSSFEVLHCGIDLDRLKPNVSRDEMRRELGIDRTAFVVGHVGRFSQAKNHVFFERVARVLHARNGKTHFVLLGDEAVSTLFDRDTYKNTVHVLGVKTNVADYLQAMDVFLFPSRSEGLGLALLEAQAMGLPCVYSDAIPEEAEVCRPLMFRMSLEAAPETWADAVELAGRSGSGLDQECALRSFRRSSFDITESVQALEALYRAKSGVLPPRSRLGDGG
jgi:glycosyltransferase involved in cell wall biosynthesis